MDQPGDGGGHQRLAHRESITRARGAPCLAHRLIHQLRATQLPGQRQRGIDGAGRNRVKANRMGALLLETGEQVAHLLGEIARRGVSILLVEQKLTIALRISKRLYVMGHGRIVFEGTPAQLAADAAVRKEWLEV